MGKAPEPLKDSRFSSEGPNAKRHRSVSTSDLVASSHCRPSVRDATLSLSLSEQVSENLDFDGDKIVRV